MAQDQPGRRPGWRPGGAQPAAHSPHARRPDHPVRPRRAEEVHDRRGAGRAARRVRGSGRARGDTLMGYKAKLRVWRGDAGQGGLADYTVEVNDGEVILDILHRLQATQTGDLAVRWN